MVVVRVNPVPEDPTSVLHGLKPVAVRALISQGADYPFHHPVLLWAVGCDEFLLQAITVDQ
jgi:hypothetical protein